MHTRLQILIAVLLGTVALSACGDDSDDGAPDAGTNGERDAGGSGGSSGAGSGGSGGASGRGGSGGSGGAAPAVTCGSTTCMSPAAGMGFVSACCVDPATSTCGTSIMGGACAEATGGDPRCPALSVMGFIMLPSCCIDGQCGIDASMFGMPGCVDLASAAERAAMSGMGSGVVIPEPRPCDDDSDAGTDDDAGL